MSGSHTDLERLAIAYLTGQVTPEDIVRYNELYETDSDFEQTVKEIEIWLAPLNNNVEDMEPPDGLFDDIMAEIQEDGESDPIIKPAAANDNTTAKWRAIAMAASVVAVLAVGSHFLPATSEMPTDNETFMALLSDSSQPELMAIVYNPNTGKVVARLSNITVPDDGDLQLWLIREGEDAPVSLGVLDRAGESNQIEFEIPKALQTGTDTLAISLEQIGGSLSAGPEGPVLYTGSVSGLTADI